MKLDLVLVLGVIGILVFGSLAIEKQTKIKDTVNSIVETIPPKVEILENKLYEAATKGYHGGERWGFKSTRESHWQKEYQDSVREYDRINPGLPSGLVLPGGETVKERFNRERSGGFR